ncbi:MAG: helix-turn-helix domain-containing protein [Candidatus Brocadiaceae baterium WH-1]|nr:MAG: helix-turn-helix domain-containing protein [Candidatus Jettenia sp. AMX2]
MIVVSTKDVLDIDSIPEHILQRSSREHAPACLVAGMTVEEAEKELIRNTLASVGGNREEASRLLGIGERTLYRKIDRYGLK